VEEEHGGIFIQDGGEGRGAQDGGIIGNGRDDASAGRTVGGEVEVAGGGWFIGDGVYYAPQVRYLGMGYVGEGKGLLTDIVILA